MDNVQTYFLLFFRATKGTLKSIFYEGKILGGKWGNKEIYFILVKISQTKEHICHRRWRNNFCIWKKYSKTIFQNQTIIISTVYIIKPKSDFWLLVSETDLQTGISNWCQTQCSWFLADFPEYQRIKYGEAGVSCVADLWRLCNVAMQSQSIARQCTGTPWAKIWPCKQSAAVQEYKNACAEGGF